MFDAGDDQGMGAQKGEAFTTWVHYIQIGFIAVIFYVAIFCGTATGG